ncbi:MAG: ATP phosphoribosyltransferase regulatory subunit [Alphaproteobacteria bacterium]|nr:MAG: ATP phosphoribosyltransferase regulatory subunit [Alphaproteobacteria bacterium]
MTDTDLGHTALLPAGLKDVLPPDAAQEAAVVERLVACFAARGYERVKPPLLEFEDTLLRGAGADVAQQTFRLMDPVSQRMLGLRADITPQVARIAATRLAGAPRPLRLCYAGQVLQVKGSQLRPERQFAQAGAELIGAASARADAEVVLLAAESLAEIGVTALSVDLNVPPLVGAVAAALGLSETRTAALRQALDRKDAAAVARVAGPHAAPFEALLRAAGPVDRALAALGALSLPAAAAAEVARLTRVVELVRAAAPDLTLTVDPVEHRGFEYQTGISFILFARGVRGELGRGGRYATPGAAGPAETATGFTLYMDSVLRALPPPPPARRLFVPASAGAATAAAARADGWITVCGLDDHGDPRAEARRLGCSHVWIDAAAVAVDDPENPPRSTQRSDGTDEHG